jgi:hypothetical protein
MDLKKIMKIGSVSSDDGSTDACLALEKINTGLAETFADIGLDRALEPISASIQRTLHESMNTLTSDLSESLMRAAGCENWNTRVAEMFKLAGAFEERESIMRSVIGCKVGADEHFRKLIESATLPKGTGLRYNDECYLPPVRYPERNRSQETVDEAKQEIDRRLADLDVEERLRVYVAFGPREILVQDFKSVGEEHIEVDGFDGDRLVLVRCNYRQFQLLFAVSREEGMAGRSIH